MFPSCRWFLLFFCLLYLSHIISCKPDAYNLEALKTKKDDPIASNTAMLTLFDHTLSLEHDAATRIVKFSLKQTYYNHIAKDNKEHKVTEPQFVIEVSAKFESLIIWIVGTENEWDWKNLVNRAPKEMQWGAHTINVHEGIYNALETFGVTLIKILKTMQKQKVLEGIKGIILSGHSQGGAIAELIYLLIKGKISCPFTDTFNSLGLTYPLSVFSIGSPSVIDSVNAHLMDIAYGKDIIKLIEAKDPGAMLFSGQSKVKPTSWVPKKKLGVTNIAGAFGLVANSNYITALMDGYTDKPYYGQLGHFHVILEHKFLKTLNQYDDGIGTQHLLNGSATLKKFTTTVGVDLLMATNNYHLYAVYRKDMDTLLKAAQTKKTMQMIWILISIFAVFMLCIVCVVAFCIGLIVGYFVTYIMGKDINTIKSHQIDQENENLTVYV